MKTESVAQKDVDEMSLMEADDMGVFLNEAKSGNTLDPSPYFGMPLNIEDNPSRSIGCRSLSE